MIKVYMRGGYTNTFKFPDGREYDLKIGALITYKGAMGVYRSISGIKECGDGGPGGGSFSVDVPVIVTDSYDVMVLEADYGNEFPIGIINNG